MFSTSDVVDGVFVWENWWLFSSSGGKSSGCVGGSSLAFWMVNLPWDIAMLYSVWSIASWMSTCLFAQLMLGFTQFSHGSPRMMLSFHTSWTMVPIHQNRVTECLNFPASFGDPSMLLTGSGFSSFLRGILSLFAKA